MSVTIDLANDEQLNQEIDALIRARVISITRSECDIAIDQIVKQEATRILSDRLEKFNSNEQVELMARQVIRKYMETYSGVKVLRDVIFEVLDSDSVRQRIDQITQDAIMGRCADFIKRKLDGIVQADVIQCVIEAMNKKVKEG